jgi:hypothetical protein
VLSTTGWIRPPFGSISLIRVVGLYRALHQCKLLRSYKPLLLEQWGSKLRISIQFAGVSAHEVCSAFHRLQLHSADSNKHYRSASRAADIRILLSAASCPVLRTTMGHVSSKLSLFSFDIIRSFMGRYPKGSLLCRFPDKFVGNPLPSVHATRPGLLVLLVVTIMSCNNYKWRRFSILSPEILMFHPATYSQISTDVLRHSIRIKLHTDNLYNCRFCKFMDGRR